MEKITTFRNFTGKQAKAKFASTVLHEMTSNDTVRIDAIFDEGKTGNLLELEKLEELQKKQKRSFR